MPSDHERYPLANAQRGEDKPTTPEHLEAAPRQDAPPPPPRTPSHAERCRTLAESARVATLCTFFRNRPLSSISRTAGEPEGPLGYPFGSLVTITVDALGRPLLLLSRLAEHTQNLEGCADASLLVTEPLAPPKSPLELARVTLLGPCRRVLGEARSTIREAFLVAHPDAATYVDFRDFDFYRLDPVGLRYVGGFGRMSWVEPDEYARAEPDPLAPSALAILAHMNADHADTLLTYARAFTRLPDPKSALMTAIDRYGFELMVTTSEGSRPCRLTFDDPLHDAEEARRALVAMARAARSALGGSA